MTKNEIRSAILAKIRQNGTKDITGPTLQQILLAMLDILQTGAGMNYKGNINVNGLNHGVTPENGDFYCLTDSGHVIKGDFDVTANSFVIWNADEGRWYPITGLIDVSGLQPTITGAATSITERDLSPNLLLKSDSNGKVDVSSLSVSEIEDIVESWADLVERITNAEQTANNAQQTANNAEQAANDAQQTANDASQKADAVTDIANEAKSTATETANELHDFASAQEQIDSAQDSEISARLKITDFDIYKAEQKNLDDTQDDFIRGHETRLQSVENNKVNNTAFESYKTAQTATDSEQDRRLTALENKPAPREDFVPYSADLDSVTDDLGLAWMNTNKESREFGHIYRKEQGDNVIIHKNDRYCEIPASDNREISGIFIEKYTGATMWEYSKNTGGTMFGVDLPHMKIGSKVYSFSPRRYEVVTEITLDGFVTDQGIVCDDGEAYSAFNYQGEFEKVDGTDGLVTGNSGMYLYRIGEDGEWSASMPAYDGTGAYWINQKVKIATEDIIIEQGGWKDVYDTSTISADITAEVARATAAESALSERINTKADASTWSANLKTQIDSDHTTLSGLSAKWTDILKSQIDADHTTLGTLNTYLSADKQGKIDDAIAKAHTQNTDTALAVDKVVWMAQTNTLNIVGYLWSQYGLNTNGDVYGKNGQHKLSEKLDKSNLRAYATTEDMLADMANIPNGAWCAIINTHSAGVSAQSDDIIE